MEPWFIVSSKVLEKLGIEPGLQGEWLNHCHTEASISLPSKQRKLSLIQFRLLLVHFFFFFF